MNIYCNLAKQAVEKYIQSNKVLSVSKKMPATLLTEKAGVFVTIYRNDRLRGCIGTLFATEENLAKEIIDNAIKAATKDPRFPIVKKDELPKLSYEVSILGSFEQVESVNDLNPKTYGIFTKSDEDSKRSALLLPDLPGLTSPIKQLMTCLSKANIDGEKEKFTLFRFETKKIKQYGDL